MNHKPRRVNGQGGKNRSLSQEPRRLKWRRIAAGLTIRQAAAKAGVSMGTISELENGNYSATAPTLAALAKAYECEITDLMPDEPNGKAA